MENSFLAAFFLVKSAMGGRFVKWLLSFCCQRIVIIVFTM